MLIIGIFFSDMVRFSNKYGSKTRALALGVVMIFVFSQVAIGVANMEQQKLAYPIDQGWFETFEYIDSIEDPDTAFLTWWDYGHWTAFLGQKHSIVDNLNANESKVIEVAKVFTDFDSDPARLEARVSPWLTYWKVTHIGIDRVLLYQKWGALTFLADRQCIPNSELADRGLDFPQVKQLAANVCGPTATYSGEWGITNCSPTSVTSGGITETFMDCNLFSSAPLRFTQEEWSAVQATTWPGYDLSVDTGQGVFNLKVYGQPDNNLMFMKIGSQIVSDAPINYMYGAQLFFKNPAFVNQTLVVNQWVPNKEVVVNKVI